MSSGKRRKSIKHTYTFEIYIVSKSQRHFNAENNKARSKHARMRWRKKKDFTLYRTLIHSFSYKIYVCEYIKEIQRRRRRQEMKERIKHLKFKYGKSLIIIIAN